MSAQIVLVAPSDAPADRLRAGLVAALERSAVAVLLLPRGQRAENEYNTLVKSVAPTAQKQGVAVLVEGDPGLVRKLGVDGLHVPLGLKAVEEAVRVLKPDFIVGAGDIRSRHDAMQKGELDIDYILFGPLSGPMDDAARELARWWAETMQVPCVLSDPEADIAAFDDEGCEFVAVPLVLPEQP